MSDPIALLMDEHRLIEKVLSALERWAARVEGGDDAARADLGAFVTFIREFADQKHHAKEEDILFDEMTSAGFPKEAGPIAVMLYEHDMGRDRVATLAAAAEERGPWTDEVRAGAARAAREFATLLRQHIHKEDNILYPMALQHLGAGMEEVARRCEIYEADATRQERGRELQSIALTLVQRYP